MGSKTSTTYATTTTPAWYTNYAQQILSNQNAASAQPYQPYDASRIAGFNPTQQNAFDLTAQGATAHQPGMATAMDATQNTLGRSGYNVAQPALGTAANMTMAGAAPTGLAMAQPYLQQAGQTSTANIGQYMNPYLDNVVNRYGELGARTLQEQLIPAATSKFISAGQLGGGAASSGMMTDTARALRDVQEGVAKQQADTLAGGYNTALGASQTDLARQAQLGQTAGQLGQNQQNIMLGAGSQIGQLGSTAAGLYNADTSNQLGAAAQLGQQAGALQQADLAGAGAMNQVGTQQQQQTQANLDLAYSDFLKQQGYPQAQIDQMVKTFAGLSPGIPQGTTQTTVEGNKSGTSGLATALGTGATILGSGILGK